MDATSASMLPCVAVTQNWSQKVMTNIKKPLALSGNACDNIIVEQAGFDSMNKKAEPSSDHPKGGEYNDSTKGN